MNKKIASIAIIAVFLMQGLPVSYAAENKTDIFVQNGAVNGDGSIEAPFGELSQARDYIRELKREGNYPSGGVTVNMRGGVYFLKDGLELTEEDSGKENAPVTYRSYLNEQVKLIGGAEMSLSDFKSVDGDVKEKLPVESRSKVKCIDLTQYGINEFDELPQVGHSTSYFKPPYSPKGPDGNRVTIPYVSTPAMELIYDDEAMTVSRWPNDDYVKIGDLIETHSNQELADNGVSYMPNIFKLDVEGTNRLKKWGEENDMYAFAYWSWDWSDLTCGVKVDVDSGTVTTRHALAHIPKTGQRIYFYNMLSELDIEKEWYLDRNSGILYFYPPANSGNVILTTMTTPFFEIKNAENIVIKGIEMTGVRSDGIRIENSKNINVELCVISNTTAIGILTENIYDCKFISNHIYKTGGAGIGLYGGDTKTLTRGNNLAENNDIHDFGRITKAYQGAVNIGGVGNTVRNNKMYNGDQLAMRVTGPDQLVENNEITNVLRYAGDMGAIYLYREKHFRGTVFQNNYFHDISSQTSAHHGIQGIYYDEMNDGATVKNNLFVNFGGDCIFINGGRDHSAYNNIFYNCNGAEKISAIGLNTNYSYGKEGVMESSFPELYNGDYLLEPYKKYKNLSNIMEDDPREPKYNEYKNNFTIDCGYDFKWCEIGDSFYNHLYAQNSITSSEKVTTDIFENPDVGNYTIKEEVKSKFVDGETPEFKNMGMYTPWLARALYDNTIAMAIGSPMVYRNFESEYIDNDNCNTVPVIVNDKTYLPLRYIAEALGGNVDYDEDTNKVSITVSGNTVNVNNTTNEILLNGAVISGETSIVREGRTYLPVRAIGEAVDKTVTWYEEGIVIISNDEEVLSKDDKALVEELYRRLT